MRSFLLIIGVWISFLTQAQNTLDSVQTVVHRKNGKYEIQQSFFLTISDPQPLQLRALRFDGIVFEYISVENQDFVQTTSDEEIRLNIAQYRQPLVVSYNVRPSDKLTNLPLFFTPFNASSSVDDFFRCKFTGEHDQSFYLHFPNVELITTEEGFSFQLPALPSALRIELVDGSTSRSNIVTIADWIVAVIFLAIGVLIWFNRKKLIYG